jgi:hypothetical protein
MSGKPKNVVLEHGDNLAPGWQCNYCGMHKSGGGSTRFKQHLAARESQGDSRSNEGKALPVLATRESFAMVPLSAGGDGAKLECVDESLHEGVLHTG